MFFYACAKGREQMVDQGMRDGKGVHTIRDSYYHRDKGAEKM